ncbi:unnamed protein product [Pleuronectes platessa]|uniref:Uncharacterized protein n=1 Tax=Pleuronectes platessa TaxID=8262 RepID=A0A9N7YEY5_PLEPL|nr:unnamed protein product [Pleuronectes platessa]
MAIHMASEKKPSSGAEAEKEHNSQLSRQIEGTAVGSDLFDKWDGWGRREGQQDHSAHRLSQRLRSRQRSRQIPRSPRIKRLVRRWQLALVRGSGAVDVAQQYPESWTGCLLPAKGYPLFVPRAGGSQLGMLQ